MDFLIIDDDSYKIEKVKEVLTAYTLDTANSYVKGIKKLLMKQYDGLILDMSFPLYDNDFSTTKMDMGLRVLSELKRKEMDIPVAIYSSGYTDVSGFNNIVDYIMSDSDCLEDKLIRFAKMCSKNI